MKKLAILLLAAMMLLSAASADALFTPKNRSGLAALPALPSAIPSCKVAHDEKANTYTVTVSETPVWACANLWYNGKGNVDNITFNGNTATFKGTKAQIGLWWIGMIGNWADYVSWFGKGVGYENLEALKAKLVEDGYDEASLTFEDQQWDDDEDVDGWNVFDNGSYVGTYSQGLLFETQEDLEAYLKGKGYNPEKLDFEAQEYGWNVYTKPFDHYGYSGDDALLIGYQNMNVWYTRGGIPTRVTVPMNEDPFQTGKQLSSASVTYMRDGKYSGHWYVSNVEATYANDPVAKVSVDYNDTTAGNWLRYNVTLSSGGTITYTR